MDLRHFFAQFYHLPKTCEVSSTPTIPLIQVETQGNNKEEASEKYGDNKLSTI